MDIEKAKIEEALKEAEEALKENDKDAMTAKGEALMQASHKLAEKMYANAQAPGGDAGPGPQAQAGGSSKDDGDVVDAEFEEVRDRK